MPEGDTLHRTANRLRAALDGRALVRLTLHRTTGGARRPQPGERITGVDAVGKHLLIRFERGATLHTHLRMTGAWHLYRAGERWRKPKELARAAVEVPGWIAVCFAAPVVELRHGDVAATRLAHLGPDLAGVDITDDDLDHAAALLATVEGDTTEIGALLLDQRVACGVGNVYKSEVLHACRVDPFTDARSLPIATRRALVATASRLLRANVASTGPRRTTREGVAVYGRAGRPCRRCGTPILARRQGEQARLTYWCPRCQPPA